MKESLFNKYSIFKNFPIDEETRDFVIKKDVKLPNGKNFDMTLGHKFIFDLIKHFNIGTADNDEEMWDWNEKIMLFITNEVINNEHHIFILDDMVAILLMKTDSEIKFNHLPFQSIFIDCEIPISDSIKSFGLFITEGQKELEGEIKPYLSVSGMLKILIKDSWVCFPYFNFISDNKFIKFDEKIGFFNEKEIEVLNKELNSKVPLFICNFINFLNSKDIEILHSDKDLSKQKKLNKSDKLLKASTNIIRLTGKLKIYVDSLKVTGHIDFSHRFWVRGHFREFKDERYINKKGKKIWIYPFIRGEGVLEKNKYFITGVDKNEI